MDLFDIPVQYRTMQSAQQAYDDMEDPSLVYAYEQSLINDEEPIDDEPDFPSMWNPEQDYDVGYYL